MMLADGINLPIVAALGLAVFVPLTLFVTLVESFVLRWFAGIPIKRSFRVVFLANVLSTVTGWLVYGFQYSLLGALGFRGIYSYAQYYVWIALILIAAYYVKSILVEGLIIARRRLFEPFGLTRRGLWVGVIVANAASYLFVGPLFYYTTRPTFGGTSIVLDPVIVAACNDTIYYLDRDSRLCVIGADGSKQRQITNQPVRTFWIDKSRRIVVCEGPNDDLWSQNVSGGSAFVLPGTCECDVEFSASGRRIALCTHKEVVRLGESVGHVTDYGQWQDLGELKRWIIGVFDLDRRLLLGQTVVEGHSAVGPEYCWDSEDHDLLWCSYDRKLMAFRLGPQGLVQEDFNAPFEKLLENAHSEALSLIHI